MKITLLSLVTVSLTCLYLVAADAPAKASPRFKARVVCFNGKRDSGSSCAGALDVKGKIRCGFPGRVSELDWSFIERRGTNDVYRFTRRFPSDTAAPSTTTKTVEFSDSRVVVFEDKFQAIVIEPPPQTNEAALQMWRSPDSSLRQRADAVMKLFPKGTNKEEIKRVLARKGTWTRYHGPSVDLVNYQQLPPHNYWRLEYEFPGGGVSLEFEPATAFGDRFVHASPFQKLAPVPLR